MSSNRWPLADSSSPARLILWLMRLSGERLMARISIRDSFNIVGHEHRAKASSCGHAGELIPILRLSFGMTKG
jgi:hypothetical protein